MTAPLRDRLSAAAAGLLFISESEAPLEYIEAPLPPGGTADVRAVAAAFGEPGPAREASVSDFFAGHIDDVDPADAVAQQQVPRFRALVTALEEQLRDPRSYCFGETAKRCYVVGAADGVLAGLKTTVYET